MEYKPMKIRLDHNSGEYTIHEEDIFSTIDDAYRYWKSTFNMPKKPDELIMAVTTPKKDIRWAFLRSTELQKLMRSILNNAMFIGQDIADYVNGKKHREELKDNSGMSLEDKELDFLVELHKNGIGLGAEEIPKDLLE